MKKLFKRFMSIILSTAVCFTMLVFFENEATISVSASNDNLVSGWSYYIKNVRSGKYLTVQHAQATDGQKIIQYHFTGDTNQKWKLEWTGNTGTYAGKYRILSWLNLNKVISMENSTGQNGVKAVIQPKQNDIKQLFGFTQQSYTAYRIYTNASNNTGVLAANGASIYDNTSIIQYTTGTDYSDQWLLEPVSGYNGEFAKQYANANFSSYLSAYPHYVNDSLSESTNFVSQCILAAGTHTINDGTYNWRVNKLTETTWETFPNNAWSSTTKFYYFWNNKKYNNAYSKYIISNNTDSTAYNVGDIVQILYYHSLSDCYDCKQCYIITSRPNVNNKGTYLLKGHYDVYDVSVLNMMNTYSDTYLNFHMACFYNMQNDI